MPDLEAFVDGERLGLIGAVASMEAGHRHSMLEARPFAVRTAALAHGLCGYVQVAAAEGPACIVAAESGGWLPFVVSWHGDLRPAPK